ncbi:hypothetical protein LTR17_011638 [Elasticomyces elasticus]|nr:hypothetical protein LTR17_011638 [Elasticomyces elasticus]
MGRTLDATIPGLPNTFVTDNKTLTSPTVYIQATMHLKHATDYYYVTLLAQNPTDVSSYCQTASLNWTSGLGTPQSMNYADLNYPVPARAYTCQPKCFDTSSTSFATLVNHTNTVLTSYHIRRNNQCSTIWDDYAPALQLPFLSMGGGFETPLIWYDPPQALTPTSSAAGVTTPVKGPATLAQGTRTIDAQPASSVKQPTPVATTESAAQAGGSTTAASSVMPSDDNVAVPPLGTQITGESPSWRTSSVDSQLESSDAQGSGAVRDSSTKVTLSSTMDPRSAANSVAVSTSSSQGIGDIIAGILGMSRSSNLPGSSVASDSYGGIPLPASVITGDAMETTTRAGGLEDEPSTVSEDFGTSDQNPAGIIASLFATTGAALSRDTLHSVTPSFDLAGSPSLTEGTMSVNPVSADGDRAMLAPAATTSAVVFGESSQLAVPEFAIADVTFAAGQTLPMTFDSGLVLTPGGPVVTVSGQAISVATSASYLLVGSTTIWPAIMTPTSALAPTHALLTLDGQTYTANPEMGFSFGPSAVLSPGGILTVFGYTMSLDPSGHNIAVNGVTSTLALVTGSKDIVTGQNSASAAGPSMPRTAGDAGAKAIETTSSSPHRTAGYRSWRPTSATLSMVGSSAAATVSATSLDVWPPGISFGGTYNKRDVRSLRNMRLSIAPALSITQEESNAAALIAGSRHRYFYSSDRETPTSSISINTPTPRVFVDTDPLYLVVASPEDWTPRKVLLPCVGYGLTLYALDG